MSSTMLRRQKARPYTDQEIIDVIELSWRQYHPRYPDRTFQAYRDKRRQMRDEGWEFPDARTQRERYAVPPTMAIAPTLGDGERLNPDEIWELMDKHQEVALKRAAELVQPAITVSVTADRPIGICFMSDFHLGNTGTDHRALLDDIDLITSCPYLTVFVGGDGVDNMVIGKLAREQRDHGSVGPDLQYLALADVFNRLLPNLIAVGTGNHDNWTKQLAGIDGLSRALADKPIVNIGERATITLELGEQRYVICRKHRPLYNSMYNPGHAIQQMWRHGGLNFDVGVAEHQHTPWIGEFLGHGEVKWAIRTGSYKVKDSFASEYTPDTGSTGTPIVVFHPFRKHMLAFSSIADAIEYLEVD